jgi:hypothetical protein
MTLGIMKHTITILNIRTLNTIKLIIMTLNIMKFSIMKLSMMIYNGKQYYEAQHNKKSM